MGQPRRTTEDLSDSEKSDCIWPCGKSYRATSSRNIQPHTDHCYMRAAKTANKVSNDMLLPLLATQGLSDDATAVRLVQINIPPPLGLPPERGSGPSIFLVTPTFLCKRCVLDCWWMPLALNQPANGFHSVHLRYELILLLPLPRCLSSWLARPSDCGLQVGAAQGVSVTVTSHRYVLLLR